MAAVAEVLSTVASQPDPRGCELPTCPVCADSMVAAEASAYLNDHVISYLWTCDTCGYGFVTKHAVKQLRLQLIRSKRVNKIIHLAAMSPRAQSARVCFRKSSNVPFAYRRADVLHQPLVIGDVDLRQQHRAQRFARPHEMVQVGARDVAG